MNKNFTAARNACKLCSPLGASIVFRGIKGCVPLVHGSQGCSTYIRRYVISHFREPIDIASSNFSETSAIFGGAQNLKTAIQNVSRQYSPEVIGVASTCLSETIGDDVTRIVREISADSSGNGGPAIIPVSTPSYKGTHMDGFHAAVKAAVETLVIKGRCAPGPGKSKGGKKRVNILPGFVSPADLRTLREITGDFGLDCTILPDYSETLDGESWATYQKIPSGGTSLDEIRAMGKSDLTIEFGESLKGKDTAAGYLLNHCGVEFRNIPLPIGIEGTDVFFNILSELSGMSVPGKYTAQRGRLVDSYADGHKTVFEKRVILCGDEDLTLGIEGFVKEIGLLPLISATGALSEEMTGDMDYVSILDYVKDGPADLVIGPSKAYFISRKLGIPLVRTGFPVHDRIGGQRIRHLGYGGTQELFDRIVNALLEAKQENSPVGYSYL